MQTSAKAPSRAFTLIELLVVVAVIAILAAIALPNFLEAQTRARVSRAKADQKTVGDAAEQYYIDWNTYPLTSSGSLDRMGTDPAYHAIKAYVVLSSPISYIGNARLRDPFAAKVIPGNQVSEDSQAYQFASGNGGELLAPAHAVADNARIPGAWPRNVHAVVSFGPNQVDESFISTYPFSQGLAYDPTNGTISDGDVFRCGPSGLTPRGWSLGPMLPPF